jgi:hypothetical protein
MTVTNISLAQVLDAVTNTLKVAPILERAMSYNELTEGMNDLPALEVYPQSGDQDTATATDRTTFQAKVRQTGLAIAVDYYAQQRKHIGEDMAKLVDGIDQLLNIFEQQNTSPFFGLPGIKNFRFRWERVTFEYGDPAINYVGARFTLEVRIF